MPHVFLVWQGEYETETVEVVTETLEAAKRNAPQPQTQGYEHTHIWDEDSIEDYTYCAWRDNYKSCDVSIERKLLTV